MILILLSDSGDIKDILTYMVCADDQVKEAKKCLLQLIQSNDESDREDVYITFLPIPTELPLKDVLKYAQTQQLISSKLISEWV